MKKQHARGLKVWLSKSLDNRLVIEQHHKHISLGGYLDTMLTIPKAGVSLWFFMDL